MARQEAACALAHVWTDRGGNIALGQIRREKRGSNFHPNAFTRFLADGLMAVDPELKTIAAAVSAAHSALRSR
jgi:hypothetical protein